MILSDRYYFRLVQIFTTIPGLRTFLADYRPDHSIALVPTMGALHKGHASLIRRAVAEAEVTVVSIFVNPLQFGPTEDFSRYPRTFESDRQLCESLGVAAIFAPSAETLGIGDSEEITAVVPPISLTSGLCGAFRPGHFQGVATIVTRLFNIIAPTIAYFGEKDAQQLAIIRQLVRDLHRLKGPIKQFIARVCGKKFVGGVRSQYSPSQYSPSQESGVRSQESGVRSQESGDCFYWFFVTCYGSIGGHKSTKSLSGKRLN